MNVRSYRPEDLGAVWEMHLEGLEAVGARVDDPSWDEDLNRIEDVYLDGGGEFLIGTVGGRVVAMGALRRVSGGCAEVKRMRVRPALWRRGYGQRVISTLVRRAAELGYRNAVPGHDGPADGGPPPVRKEWVSGGATRLGGGL